MSYAAIEIGGTKLQLVLGDDSGRILDRRRLEVDPQAGGPGIRKAISDTLPQLTSNGVDGIGVGFGGPVDWMTGKICRSHQVEGWSEFDIKGWLEQMTRVPVTADNDANVAALGEAMHGAGRGRNPVFYVTLGSGVGGGLVVGGQIYHGAKPGESEIGHVRLDRKGTIVEERCSGWAVDRRIREICRCAPDSVLAELTRGMSRGEARHLGGALEKEDPWAKQLLDEVAQDLAFALSHVVHLFHPEVIVLGGGLSNIGEPLRQAVASALTPHCMEAFQPGPAVVLAGLGEDAVPVGALTLAASATVSSL